ncbi:MAG: hypothetical protein EBS59_03055 [Verrucomicrobia bacterium]|nr:hypothetical protein [Verrucomicrobiota bacterium]
MYKFRLRIMSIQFHLNYRQFFQHFQQLPIYYYFDCMLHRREKNLKIKKFLMLIYSNLYHYKNIQYYHLQRYLNFDFLIKTISYHSIKLKL